MKRVCMAILALLLMLMFSSCAEPDTPYDQVVKLFGEMDSSEREDLLFALQRNYDTNIVMFRKDMPEDIERYLNKLDYYYAFYAEDSFDIKNYIYENTDCVAFEKDDYYDMADYLNYYSDYYLVFRDDE